MARLGAQVVGTSLKVPSVPTGYYSFEIREIEDKKFNSGAEGLRIVFRVTEDVENDGANVGRTIIHNIILSSKNGDYNEIGGRELRNLIVAACGDDAANDEDFETAALANCVFGAQLTSKPQRDDPDMVNYSFSKFTSL